MISPLIDLSADSLNFGNVEIGETATEQVTVKNTGTYELNIFSIAISGVDSLNFIEIIPSDEDEQIIGFVRE